MKEFNTAVSMAEKDATEEKEWRFKVDGHEVVAYEATPAQVAVVLSSVGRHSSMTTKIAGIIDFFMAVFRTEDAEWLSQRLLDREDKFGIPQVEAILSWLIEEWTGHPTQGQSDSSPSLPTTGTSSTPKQEVSTSST